MLVRLLDEDVNRLQASVAFFEIEIRFATRRKNMTRQGRESFFEGYAAIFATVLIWSTPSLFQFYLNRFYDPWAQNFYRYAVAFLAVLPFVFYGFRRSDVRLNGGILLACLV